MSDAACNLLLFAAGCVLIIGAFWIIATGEPYDPRSGEDWP